MKQTSLDPKQFASLAKLPNILRRLRGSLIVSCQAEAGEPMYGEDHMTAMARAAAEGGAVRIRANTSKDIAAIRRAINLTIIGIYKLNLLGYNFCAPIVQLSREAVIKLTHLIRGEKNNYTNCFTDSNDSPSILWL
jgi:putative N-acetylmannosamine-6-phosphate epimerase